MTAAPTERDPLSHFWAPLTAVGSHDPVSRRPNAQICVSVFGASIVPDRPRLLVVLSRTNYTHDLVAASGSLAITLLSETQVDLLDPLGLHSGRDGDKLDGLDYALTPTGDPYFRGGVACIAGRVIEAYDLGDSTALLVTASERERLEGGEPMQWSVARERLGDDFMRRWQEKSAREQEAARAAMRWPST